MQGERSEERQNNPTKRHGGKAVAGLHAFAGNVKTQQRQRSEKAQRSG